MINAEDILFFNREGYLVLEDFFSQKDLQPVVDEISSEIDRLALNSVRAGELSRTYENEPFEKRLVSISGETKVVYDSIKAGNLNGPSIFGLIVNEKLLDVAEQLCGPEIVASSVYRLRPKLPGDPVGCIPWHQDSGYFEPHCDSNLIVTVWIPLVDATRARGCLWVLPRAHQNGVYKHTPHPGKIYLEISSQDLPYGQPICVPLRKGGILLMTNRTPHGSVEINCSDVIRWSIDVRYQSSDVPTNAFVPTQEADRGGADLEDSLIACYPPEQDFLARSVLRPSAVCRTADQFRLLRQRRSSFPMTDRWNLRALGQDGWHGFSNTYRVSEKS